MATVNVTAQRTGKVNSLAHYTYASVSAGDKIKINAGYRDFQALVLFIGGAADTTLTIKAGNGLAGVNDATRTLNDGEYAAMVVDASRFMNVTGADKGKIVIEADKACSVAVVEQGLVLQTDPNA